MFEIFTSCSFNISSIILDSFDMKLKSDSILSVKLSSILRKSCENFSNSEVLSTDATVASVIYAGIFFVKNTSAIDPFLPKAVDANSLK